MDRIGGSRNLVVSLVRANIKDVETSYMLFCLTTRVEDQG